MDRPLALVVALATERRALEQRLVAPQVRRLGSLRLAQGAIAGQVVVLIQAGVGAARARSALLMAAREFHFRAAWSLGLAGGLAADLGPGDLICPAVVLLDDGRQGQVLAPSAPYAMIGAALQGANPGALLTVEAPLRTTQAKRNARERTGAVAVDMEAAGVATAARDLEIPWLAIKAVADDAREPLPEFLAGCTTPAGDLRWRGLLWSCLYGERRRVFRRLRRKAGLATLSLKRTVDVALRAGSP
jgi:adenosylhomocysteine nucleosidase